MRVRAIDSHTGGEPTRVVPVGEIELLGATMAERRDDLTSRLDHLRRGLVLEPRGSEVLVGAILTPPVAEGSLCGVVFFNNVGALGMCGHGTIGVAETMRWLGSLNAGEAAFDTPVGPVRVTLSPNGDVSLMNVVSYRREAGVALDVEGIGRVVGDVAYGGNWFFVVHEPTFGVALDRVQTLTRHAWAIRHALEHSGRAREVDHIELAGDDGRNFVLCPGGAYDRSPCGTGTSAKLACLHADGLLAEGEEYVQVSVTGSAFRGRVRRTEGGVIPTITGRAHVVGDLTLWFNDDDPLRWGLA